MKSRKWLWIGIIVLLLVGGYFGFNQLSVLDTSFREKIEFTYARTDTGASIPYARNLGTYQIGSEDTINIKWVRSFLDTDLSNFIITHNGQTYHVYEQRGRQAFFDGSYKYEAFMSNLNENFVWQNARKLYYDGDNNVINTEYYPGEYPQILTLLDEQIGFKITDSGGDGYNYYIGKDKHATLGMTFDPNIIINISNKEVLQFASDTKLVTTEIENNYIPIDADILLNVKYTTPSGATETESYTKSMVLPTGTSKVDFEIPIKISGEITLQAVVQYKLIQPGEDVGMYSADGNYDYGITECEFRYCSSRSGCDTDEYRCYADVEKKFNVASDDYRVLIVPQPLWLEKEANACPVGYIDELVVNENGTEENYCVRADLKELSCVEFGCPVVPGHNYECTSAGVCAETVYIYKDCRTEGCPSGDCVESSTSDDFVCLVNETEVVFDCTTNPEICPSDTSCEPNSKTCINTIIKEKIIECSVSSDCYKPCQGVVPTCNGGICEYSGSCTGITPTCEDFSCGIGASCIETDTGIACEQNPIFSFKTVIIIIVSGLVISGAIYLYRRRKK